MTVIDVHTHMLSQEWFDLLKEHGAPRYEVKPSKDYPAPLGIHMNGAPFMTPQTGHFDYDMRIEKMDEARVDLAIVTLTCPNVFWGGAEISLKAARIMNDDMAAAQTTYPNRIRWMASLPWEHPELAVAELERACGQGAIGVMVLANIAGRSLTEPAFAPIWQAIDKRGLPVLVHPTAPPGVAELDMIRFNLIAQIGFMFDTTLAIARMIYDGFFDRYPSLKIIVPHSGGTLPFIAGRLDNGYRILPACSANISQPPSAYLNRIYVEDAMARAEAAALAMGVCGADNYLHGSDYPFIPVDRSLAWADDLEPAVRDAVLGGNAQALFGL